LVLFFIAGISDAIDGFIARRFNMRTELGATLDPLADKILIIATVLALWRLGLLPIWLMMVIVCRDLVIAGGALTWHCAIGRVEMAPNFMSKVNTFMQVGMIFLLLVQASGMIRISSWQPFLFGLVFLTSVLSGIQYVWVWGMKAWNRCRVG
jgi:cardiolipin synthase